MPLILTERFENGQELTNHELQQAYKRITGKEYPRGAKPGKIAQHLITTQPLRFEFEINRLRGFAWDAEEVV